MTRLETFFILLQGGIGFDNSAQNGGVTSFGAYKNVNGGLGALNGRCTHGDSAFFAIALEPNMQSNNHWQW